MQKKNLLPHRSAFRIAATQLLSDTFQLVLMPFFEHHPIWRILLGEEHHFGHFRIHFYRGLDGEQCGTLKTLLTKPFFIFFKLVGSGFGQNTFAGLNRHCGWMRKIFIWVDSFLFQNSADANTKPITLLRTAHSPEKVKYQWPWPRSDYEVRGLRA